ncbi:CheY-like superfamily [Trichoderma evansii]
MDIDIAHEKTSKATPQTQKEEEEAPEPEFLLVEDNPINLRILSLYMKKLGRAHHTATNGSLAVEAYKANPNYCKHIFMDVSLPVMDGFEATRNIRAYEREHQLKPCFIFGLTHLLSESAQQEASGSGMDLLLTKPRELKQLAMILQSRGLLPDKFWRW